MCDVSYLKTYIFHRMCKTTFVYLVSHLTLHFLYRCPCLDQIVMYKCNNAKYKISKSLRSFYSLLKHRCFKKKPQIFWIFITSLGTWVTDRDLDILIVNQYNRVIVEYSSICWHFCENHCISLLIFKSPIQIYIANTYIWCS